MNRTSLSGMKRDGREERDLAPTVLCTRRHVEVLTEDSLFLFWKLMRAVWKLGDDCGVIQRRHCAAYIEGKIGLCKS